MINYHGLYSIAGLLTPDLRVKERQKPGRQGARRRYTWYEFFFFCIIFFIIL